MRQRSLARSTSCVRLTFSGSVESQYLVGSSFDHFRGECEQLWRNVETTRFCGLDVDDEIKLGRLQHWQIGCLPCETAASVDAGLTVSVGNIRSVTDETASKRYYVLGRSGTPVCRT